MQAVCHFNQLWLKVESLKLIKNLRGLICNQWENFLFLSQSPEFLVSIWWQHDKNNSSKVKASKQTENICFLHYLTSYLLCCQGKYFNLQFYPNPGSSLIDGAAWYLNLNVSGPKLITCPSYLRALEEETFRKSELSPHPLVARVTALTIRPRHLGIKTKSWHFSGKIQAKYHLVLTQEWNALSSISKHSSRNQVAYLYH